MFYTRIAYKFASNIKGYISVLHRYNFFYDIINLQFFRISPEGVDVVFDCICGDECNRGYNLLKPMGRYILFGSSNVVTGETKSLFSAAKAVSFYTCCNETQHLYGHYYNIFLLL